MCSAGAPKPPPTPPPPPDYLSENAAQATQVDRENRKRVFAGLNSTIRNAASGVLKLGPIKADQ